MHCTEMRRVNANPLSAPAFLILLLVFVIFATDATPLHNHQQQLSAVRDTASSAAAGFVGRDGVVEIGATSLQFGALNGSSLTAGFGHRSYVSLDNGYFACFDSQTSALLWQHKNFGSAEALLFDVSGSGAGKLLAVNTANRMYILDAASGAVVNQFESASNRNRRRRRHRNVSDESDNFRTANLRPTRPHLIRAPAVRGRGTFVIYGVGDTLTALEIANDRQSKQSAKRGGSDGWGLNITAVWSIHLTGVRLTNDISYDYDSGRLFVIGVASDASGPSASTLYALDVVFSPERPAPRIAWKLSGPRASANQQPPVFSTATISLANYSTFGDTPLDNSAPESKSLFVTLSNQLLCVAVSNGSVWWNVSLDDSLPTDSDSGRPLYHWLSAPTTTRVGCNDDDEIVFVGSSERLFAVNATNGNVLWTVAPEASAADDDSDSDDDDDNAIEGPVYATAQQPVLVSLYAAGDGSGPDEAVLAVTGRSVVCVAIADGAVLWRQQYTNVTVSASAGVTARIAVDASDGLLRVLASSLAVIDGIDDTDVVGPVVTSSSSELRVFSGFRLRSVEPPVDVVPQPSQPTQLTFRIETAAAANHNNGDDAVLYESAFYCYFVDYDSEPTPAVASPHDANLLSCPTPRSQSSTTGVFSISIVREVMNRQSKAVQFRILTNALSFALYAPLEVTAVTPIGRPFDALSTAAQASVSGKGFQQLQSFLAIGHSACRWSIADESRYVPAVIVSDTLLQCPFPVDSLRPIGPATLLLAATIDLVHYFPATTSVMLYEPAIIEGIEPKSGPTTGATAITVSGSHFLRQLASTIHCILGDLQRIPAMFVSDTQLVCKTNAIGGGGGGTQSVALTVTQNGIDVDRQPSAVVFTFYDPPKPTRLQPTNGPTAGGTTVTLSVSVFFVSDLLRVRFETTEATVISQTVSEGGDGEIVVLSPANKNTGTVPVRISLNGGVDWSAALPFTYLQQRCPGSTETTECSGNGICNITTNSCQCTNGFFGLGCDRCNGSVFCSGRGECRIEDSNQIACDCNQPFFGDYCQNYDGLPYADPTLLLAVAVICSLVFCGIVVWAIVWRIRITRRLRRSSYVNLREESKRNDITTAL